MNRQASINRVANTHLGRMQKRSALFDKAKEPVAKAFLQSQAEKEKKDISNEGLAGLAFLQKKLGLKTIDSFAKALGQSKYDPKDPIQKMVAEACSRAKSVGEAGDILGRFSKAYQKQDVAKMARVVGVETETMALVLLWYVRDNRSLAVRKASHSRESSAGQALVLEKALSLSGSVLSQLSHYIGVGLSWVWSFITPNLPTGKLWTAIYFTLNKAWGLITYAGGMALGLLKAALVKSTATFGLMAVIKVLGIGVAVYYTAVAMAWLSFQTLRLPGKILIEFPLKAIYYILKKIYEGTLKISSKLYRHIKESLLGAGGALDPDDPMFPVVEGFAT
jgi:hypothetical protein